MDSNERNQQNIANEGTEIKTYIYDQLAIQNSIVLLNQLVNANGLRKCEIALKINELLSSPIKEDVYIHTK